MAANDTFDARRAALSAALADVYAVQATGDRAALAAATERARAAAEGFATFTDPREHVGLLADDAPFALFPVRLETRFMTGADQGARLLVRIYPDDCSIDTFEAMLSATELANAKIYWQNYWNAGGAEAGQRGAWRDLVAAHGSGRAGYIVDSYQPVNQDKAPGKADPPDPGPVFPPDPPVKQSSWTQAPQVRQFPERFIVIGYVAGEPVVQQIGGLVTLPLYTGPDPGAYPSEGIHIDGNGDLFVPDQLRWMTDYDAAVAAGLAHHGPADPQPGADRIRPAARRRRATGGHRAGRRDGTGGTAASPPDRPQRADADPAGHGGAQHHRYGHRLHHARRRGRQLRRQEERAAVQTGA